MDQTYHRFLFFAGFVIGALAISAVWMITLRLA